jgi:hypothetical protein
MRRQGAQTGPCTAILLPRTIPNRNRPKGPIPQQSPKRQSRAPPRMATGTLAVDLAAKDMRTGIMPVKKDIQPPNTESLVVDHLVVRLDLLDPSLLTLDENPPPSAATLIGAGIREICAAPEDTTVTFRERALKIIKPDPDNPSRGTQLLSSGPGSACVAQIVFAPADEPEPHISVRCALIKNSTHEKRWGEYTFEVQVNDPTALLTGNSVLPATIADRDTGNIPFPSSARPVNAIMNRLPFEFLATLHQQITGRDDALFDAMTAGAIKRGEFTIVRIRWHCNLSVENGERFFQLLALAFGHTISTPDGIHDLATHLGLRFRIRTDPESHRVTSVVFEKRRGKNSVYTIEFNHTKKAVVRRLFPGGPPDPETALDLGTVRLAITAHGPAIIDMGEEAQDALKNYRKRPPKFLEAHLPTEQFLERTPEQNAWWLERAIQVLAFRRTGELVRARRATFAEWLVPKMIDHVLRLTSIVQCTPEGLHKFFELDNPVIKAWRETVGHVTKNWAFNLGFAAGVGHTTVYNLRKLWLRKYHVDIEIPYVFYRDLEFFGPHSFTEPENRAALIAAMNEGDGEEALRFLVEASGNFFAQLAHVVGRAISSPPILLPTRLAGNVSADSAIIVPPSSRKPKPSATVTAQLNTPARVTGKQGVGSKTSKAPAKRWPPPKANLQGRPAKKVSGAKVARR